MESRSWSPWILRARMSFLPDVTFACDRHSKPRSAQVTTSESRWRRLEVPGPMVGERTSATGWHPTEETAERNHHSPCAQPPVESDELKVTRPGKVAGGLTSVLKAAEFTIKEPGLVRGVNALAHLNQFGGIDCPGCAWPDPDHERSLNEYCENGVKAIAEEATAKRCTPEFFQAWSVRQLSEQSDYWLGHQGRLTHPMVLRAGSEHYEAISWDDAFQVIARDLNTLSSPDEAIFYTSGRTSNEAAFLYQLFVRQFGTNNLPDCSNMCHESSGLALREVVGVGKGTVKLEDFDLADTILIIGQNPGTNHPRMLSTLQRAARRGAKIISVNPLAEVGLTRFKHPKDVLHLLGSAACSRDDSGDCESAAARWTHGAARGWRLPGKRALQRPRRSHHGHLGADASELPR
jgi:hypothetical protein